MEVGIFTPIGNNGWLSCPAQEELIFDTNLDSKYERALALHDRHAIALLNCCM